MVSRYQQGRPFLVGGGGLLFFVLRRCFERNCFAVAMLISRWVVKLLLGEMADFFNRVAVVKKRTKKAST